MKIPRELRPLMLFSIFTWTIGSCAPADDYGADEQRYLLLDSRIVQKVEAAGLRHAEVRKNPANPLIREGFRDDPPRPWEARFDNVYPNVIFDREQGLFRAWYKSFVRDASSEATPIHERPRTDYSTSAEGRRRGILYAYSEDGIHWNRPELDLIDFEGSSENNLVILDFEGGVFRDERDPEPERRYKMFGRIDRDRQMAVAYSPDGLVWSEPEPWPEHNVQGDAHSNAIWSSSRNSYVGMTRDWDQVRLVVRTESSDFVHWSEPEEVLRGEGPHEQIYSMPIFEYANVYLGLPSVIHDDDTVDTELAWSPDTKNWYRILPGEAIIPRGDGLREYPDSDYDAGCIFASVPVFLEDEILLYYGGSNYYHTDWRESSLNLAHMRKDGFAGFASLNAETAVVEIGPFTVTGPHLKINADFRPGGSLRAALLGPAGEELPSFSLEESDAIHSDAVDQPVRWNGKGIESLEGNDVSVRLEFNRATVYSVAGHLEFVSDD